MQKRIIHLWELSSDDCRPTASRLPGESFKDYTTGIDNILSTKGPLCTDRDTLQIFMKTVLDTKPWINDSTLLPLPWLPFSFQKPLKVAIQWCDGVVKPHPPVIRALKEVSTACKVAGMDVVDWVSLEHAKAWQITSALYFPDAGEEVLATLREGEEDILPLTNFIINEQANVKLRSQQELLEVSVECFYRYMSIWKLLTNGDYY